MTRVTIVGTGDQAHALAHLYSNYNSRAYGDTLEVTKPNVVSPRLSFHHTGVPVTPFKDAIQRADVIILAIPATALKVFVANCGDMIDGKILVDVTNSSGMDRTDLRTVVGMSRKPIQFVKAFNDIGAVDLLLNKPTGKGFIGSKMCSDSPKALKKVKAFAERSLGIKVKTIPMERYDDIAFHQDSLGPKWLHSAYILFGTFLVAELYALLRYNVFKGYQWWHLPLQVTNKAVCWTALYGFSYSQLPGLFARMTNASSDSLEAKSPWLVSFLSLRKELGLLSLWFLLVHIIMSLLLMGPAYYGKFFVDKTSGVTKMNAIGEASMFMGVFGAAFYFILGICSLPSVGANMTNRQWSVVYGYLAWTALIFGTVHVLIMGVDGWTKTSGWPGGMPPITMTSVLVPLATIGLKFGQVLFFRGSGSSSKQQHMYERQDQTSTFVGSGTGSGSGSRGGSRSDSSLDDKDSVP